MWLRCIGGTLSLKLVLAYQFWTLASAFPEQTVAPIPCHPWGMGGSNLLRPRQMGSVPGVKIGARSMHILRHAKLLQLCLTLCDPMDCSPPDSPVHGILQARMLEWIAMLSFRGSPPTQGLNPHLLSLLCWQVGSLLLALYRKPSRSVR